MQIGLEDEIETIRKELLLSAELKGLHSSETLELSKRLDALLNELSNADTFYKTE